MFERQTVCDEVRAEKYARDGELTPSDIHARVLDAVLDGDPRRDEVYGPMKVAMDTFQMLPAGRVLAGAGAGRTVTWINCFVNRKLDDSMMGIVGDGLLRMAVTLQRGGGMGTDFSPVRPKGALVKGTHTRASGVVSFMGPYDSTSTTVESAGERRGAQMATLRIDHPDIEAFIAAKRDGGLKGMNLSVLVTDDFMKALAADEEFDLGHEARPFDPAGCAGVREREGKPWYVYRRVPARDLWDRIMRSTYEFAEPGVIFIDRVNELNNLAPWETIIGSNPCGEQMLPPDGVHSALETEQDDRRKVNGLYGSMNSGAG